MANNLANKNTWLANVVFCFLLVFAQLTNADLKHGSSRKKLEVEKLLKKLNKPAVKSIQSPDGDIIDCVSLLNQPAFDHPKLKNHKIQMKPKFHPQGKKLEESEVSPKSNPVVQLWHQSGSCPEGTIPIRRTRKEDVLRASSIQQFGKKNPKILPRRSYVEGQGSEFASVYVQGDKYYGAKAAINTWNPNVQQKNEFSVSQIWVMNDADVENLNLNTIEVGWQVNPQLYGDNSTRLFTYWTSDNYKNTGCYDLLCSGFVQLDAGVAVGVPIAPLSIYGDENSQYGITIMIWKDKENGDWWMQYGADKVMGYWPSSLFSRLSDSASTIEWGGQVLNSQSNGQHTTTQMGSGHFSGEGFGKASYFKNIKIINDKNQLVDPTNTVTSIDRPNCYNVETGNSDDMGSYFYFGGPGRNPNCP